MRRRRVQVCSLTGRFMYDYQNKRVTPKAESIQAAASQPTSAAVAVLDFSACGLKRPRTRQHATALGADQAHVPQCLRNSSPDHSRRVPCRAQKPPMLSAPFTGRHQCDLRCATGRCIYLQVELGLKKLAGLIECFFLRWTPSPDAEEQDRGAGRARSGNCRMMETGPKEEEGCAAISVTRTCRQGIPHTHTQTSPNASCEHPPAPSFRA